jgi:hypothetical protein
MDEHGELYVIVFKLHSFDAVTHISQNWIPGP